LCRALSRRLGIATVDIYTAGYIGVVGGTVGPKSRRAALTHISNYSEVGEGVLSLVRGPLFGVGGFTADMLSELRRIREPLEKQSK